MHDPQVLVGKHHRVVFGACVVGVDFRVAGEVMPGQVHGLFVQRVRDGGIHLAVHGKFNDLAHILEGSVSGSRADLTDSEIFRFEQPHVKNINGTRLIKPLTRVRYGVDAAIRANNTAGPFQDGCITHHKRLAAFIHFGVLQRLDRNLRSDTCRVAHCDA